MLLLQERDAERARERERLRLATRDRLRRALAGICPGLETFVFGSITHPGKFYHRSDVDLALKRLPEGVSLYGLTGWLEEEMGCRVDVVLLNESRLAKKILAEGERWIA